MSDPNTDEASPEGGICQPTAEAVGERAADRKAQPRQGRHIGVSGHVSPLTGLGFSNDRDLTHRFRGGLACFALAG